MVKTFTIEQDDKCSAPQSPGISFLGRVRSVNGTDHEASAHENLTFYLHSDAPGEASEYGASVTYQPKEVVTEPNFSRGEPRPVDLRVAPQREY